MTITNLSAENYDGTSTLPSATGTNSIAIGVGATVTSANTVAIAADVDFTGDTYNVLWDKSTDDFVFDQGARLDFGGGASIYRDASGIFRITGPSASDTYFSFSNNLIFYRSGSAAAQLMYSSGSQRFHAYGNITVGGTVDGVDIAQNIPATLGTAGQVLTVNSGGTAGEWADAAGGGFDSDLTLDDKTANYTVVAGDAGKVISHSSNDITISLTAAATLGAGFHVWIKNEAGAGDITTIDPDGTETIDGRGTEKLYTGESIHIYTDGLNWYSLDRTIMWVGNTSTDYFARPTAAGGGAIAAGLQSSAGGADSVAVGYTASASGSNSVALGWGPTSTSTRSVAIGWSRASSTEAFAVNIGSSSSSYGASGSNSIAMGYLSKATSANSIAIGNQNIAETNINSAAIGGLSNTASGNYSIIAGGNANTASGARGAVLGGQANSATGSYSAVTGGFNGTASNNYSTVAGGYFNTASGHGSFAHGMQAVATVTGQRAYASGQFAAAGDAQGGQFILRADTTDAAAEALTTNNSTATSTNQIVAATDTCITFSGTVVAMQNGASSYGSWEIRGLLVNDGGTTTLPIFNISEIGSSGWKLNLYADNTNNALNVQATGVAATNIRWVANIATAEVTYA